MITPRWNACDNSSNVAISPYKVHFWEIKIHVCKHKRHIEGILNYNVKLHFDKKMMQPWTCRKFVFWQQIDFIPKKKDTPVQKIIYSTSLMQEGVFSLVYARVLMFLKTTSWIILELKRLQNYTNYWVMYGNVFNNQLVGHSNLGIGRTYFWRLSPKYMLWFSECFNHYTCSCK